MMSKLTLIALLLAVLSGCNGTIEDEQEVSQSIAANSALDVNYDGIHDVDPVAHDAAQVIITPFTSTLNNYSYLVFLDGKFDAPVASAVSSSLKRDSNNKFNILVRGLEAGKTYAFSVRIYDPEKRLMDANTKKLMVTTEAQEHPVFGGIKTVTNVGGFEANSSLNVSWTKATPASISSIFDQNFISGYKIYYKKAGQAYQTVLINDPNTTNYVLGGLDANTLYYIYVQALDSRSPPRQESNKLEISLATLGETIIKFNGATTASVPSNMSGLNNINLTWDAGTGPFTYYRIFYTSNIALPFITPTTGLPVEVIDIFDTSLTSYSFYVPDQVTDYVVGVTACDGSNCATMEPVSASVLLPVSTSPPVAPFSGIDQIDMDIDIATLRWNNLPDGTRGAYNSYKILGYNKSQGGLPASASEITSVANVDGLSLDSVPAGSAKSAKIIGLTLSDEYCFKVQSRLIHDSGEETYPNNGWLCKYAVFLTPSPVSFLSAPDSSFCHNISTSSFGVKWTPSTVGNVSAYKVFVTAGPTVNWAGPSYQVAHTNAANFSFTANNLPAGTSYAVGVKPIYIHNATLFEGTNSVEISCLTEQKNLVPNEWVAMTSVGQKFNGLSGAVVPEVFMEPGDQFIDDTTVDFSIPAEYSEVKGLPPVNNSNSSQGSQGMVRLAWLDYTFENEANSFFSIGQTDPSLGYQVYRQVYTGSSPSGTWDLVSASPIKAKTFYVGAETMNLAVFHDYTLPPATDAFTAKAYWYKVVPVFNGNTLPMVNPLPADYVVKVVVPPRNMAAIHPWNVNRETCKRLYRNYNRANQYRCNFNGLLSKNIGGDDAYDFGGHLLVDRFEAGCNFSRTLCNNTEAGGNVGDCIGINLPNKRADNSSTLLNGTVHYRRIVNDATCRLYDGSWKGVDTLDATAIANAITNNANMPPLGLISRNKLNTICSNRNLVFSNGGTPQALTSRLPTKAEYVAINAPALETMTYRQVELGVPERGCSLAASTFSKSMSANNVSLLNFSNNRYPATSHSEVAVLNRSFVGPVFSTGSSGSDSTSLCVGRYGIQDVLGNAAEWTYDNISCSDVNNCTLTQFDNRDLVNSFETINSSSTSRITGLSFYNNLANAAYSTNVAAFSQFTNVTNGFGVADNADFISLVMGLPLSCGGNPYDGCKVGGVYTDDVRFSRKNSHPLSSEPMAFNYPQSFTDRGASRVWIPWRIDAASYALGGNALDTSTLGLAFVVGNFPCSETATTFKCAGAINYNGRYSYTAVTPSSSNAMVGGRCASFIETDVQGDFTW